MKNHTTKIAGLSLAALLALTACGDGDDTSNGSEDNGGEETAAEVFEFEAPAAESQQGPYDEVTIQVPDELLENEAEYADNRVLESVTLRAAEADEPGKCAMEADYNYSETVGDDPTHEGFTATLEHDNEHVAGLPDVSEGVETEDGRTITEVIHREEDYNTNVDLIADRVHHLYEAPEHEVYSRLLGVDLDEEAESYETVTHEVSCSGETLPIAFHTVEWIERDAERAIALEGHGGELDVDGNLSELDQALLDTGVTWTPMSVSRTAFAEVEASVDSEGNITLYAPGIDGWEYDNNGNWITR